MFIEIFGGNVGTIGPEDGLVKAKLDEIALITQLSESWIGKQRCQVNLTTLAIVE